MIISKELLSEVLGLQKARNIKIHSLKGSTLSFSFLLLICGELTKNTHSYNIYELAHECKEWVHKKGISIYCIQYKVGKGEYYLSLYDIANGDHVRGIEIDSITYDTEFEAVIKACEWVRVQNDK